MLLDACRHGIDVRVVVDKSNATARYTAATFLANQGVAVRSITATPSMHDKFIEVDGETLETGSFNYTAAGAFRNGERPGAARSGCGMQRNTGRSGTSFESEEMPRRY